MNESSKRKYAHVEATLTKLPSQKKRKESVHFSQELAEQICELISAGEPLTKICRIDGMPEYRSVLRWIDKHPEFRQAYEWARIKQADALSDKILDLAERAVNDPHGAHGYRCAADILRWQAAVRAPRKYSHRLRQEIEVAHAPKSAEEVQERIRELERKLGITQLREAANLKREDELGQLPIQGQETKH
jgi:hypothetical protein